MNPRCPLITIHLADNDASDSPSLVSNLFFPLPAFHSALQFVCYGSMLPLLVHVLWLAGWRLFSNHHLGQLVMIPSFQKDQQKFPKVAWSFISMPESTSCPSTSSSDSPIFANPPSYILLICIFFWINQTWFSSFCGRHLSSQTVHHSLDFHHCPISQPANGTDKLAVVSNEIFFIRRIAIK